MVLPTKESDFQYAEFRNGFDKDVQDTRLVFYGIRYLLEAFIARQWTQKDVDNAAAFFRFVDFSFILTWSACNLMPKCCLLQYSHGTWLHRFPIPQGHHE